MPLFPKTIVVLFLTISKISGWSAARSPRVLFWCSKMGGERDVVPRVQILLIGKRRMPLRPGLLFYRCDVVRRELCSLGEVTIRYS